MLLQPLQIKHPTWPNYRYKHENVFETVQKKNILGNIHPIYKLANFKQVNVLHDSVLFSFTTHFDIKNPGCIVGPRKTKLIWSLSLKLKLQWKSTSKSYTEVPTWLIRLPKEFKTYYSKIVLLDLIRIVWCELLVMWNI